MFFEDHEKRIYSPESKPDLKFDPLQLDRALTLATGGYFSTLLKLWKPVEKDASGLPVTGDVSKEGVAQAEVERCNAEESLVKASRTAFGLPDTLMDAEVLEILCDYLWWMEKKGQRGETPPTSSIPTEDYRGVVR